MALRKLAGNIKVEIWPTRRKACKRSNLLQLFRGFFTSIVLDQVHGCRRYDAHGDTHLLLDLPRLSHCMDVAARRFVNAPVQAVIAISPHSAFQVVALHNQQLHPSSKCNVRPSQVLL
jgi:hypothetical protein